MAVHDILSLKGPRKLLAIDGGGIRGVLSVEVLARIERLARAAYGDPQLVLADCFDYFAGTSTGAIIAALLAIGSPVDQIRDLYVKSGHLIFSSSRLRDRLRFRYHDEPLARMLKDILGAETTLGSDRIRTLLMLMLRNASTDSPWPVSNNPAARFNQPESPSCNLHFPLWQLVRASTAAPVFFPPEVITVGDHDHVFVDGGVTPYANPAFQLFLMATVDAYKLQWPAGEQRMLLVSIGTGMAPHVKEDLTPHDMNLLYQAANLPQALLSSSAVAQDMLCRVFGRCRVGAQIDSEIDDLIGSEGPLSEKLFTYLRYDVELSRRSLDQIGLPHIAVEQVRQLDAVHAVPHLQEIGIQVGMRVAPEHFAGFFPATNFG